MSTEKPLHVQVAESLGWTGVAKNNGGVWFGHKPGVEFQRLISEVPGFGETWCATGGLCERFQIVVGPEYNVVDGELVFADKWGAKMGLDRTGTSIEYAATPCEAVAKVIVKASLRGELKL